MFFYLGGGRFADSLSYIYIYIYIYKTHVEGITVFKKWRLIPIIQRKYNIYSQKRQIMSQFSDIYLHSSCTITLRNILIKKQQCFKLIFAKLIRKKNKRSVLHRQSRNINRNIKRLVYCQYGQYSLFRA